MSFDPFASWSPFRIPMVTVSPAASLASYTYLKCRAVAAMQRRGENLRGDFGGVPAVGAEVEPRSRGELRDGDEACRLPMFDAVRVVHLSIQLLAGGEAAKPPLVRRNLSERALFRDRRSALLRVEVGDGRHLANEREAGRT